MSDNHYSVQLPGASHPRHWSSPESSGIINSRLLFLFNPFSLTRATSPLPFTSYPCPRRYPHQPPSPQRTIDHGQLPRIHLRYRAGQGQLLLLLQDRRMPTRRPLLAETRQAVLLADHPDAQHVPKPRLRPEEQDEPESAAEPLRRLLRGRVVRDVQVRRDRGTGCMR